MAGIYFNTYLEHERYGGPEEGGWYFTVGELEKSRKVSNRSLKKLEKNREKKLSKLDKKWYSLATVYRQLIADQKNQDNEKKIKKLSKQLDKIEDKKQVIYESHPIAILNRQAKKINQAYEEDTKIELKFRDTGGYQFLLGDDSDDPQPVAYYGNQKFVTVVENHKGKNYPKTRPPYE